MSASKKLRRNWRDLCAELHDDDGFDPRLERRDRRKDQQTDTDRKLWQLCRAAARALPAALAELSDDMLSELDVHAVRPTADAVVVDRMGPHVVGREEQSFLQFAPGVELHGVESAVADIAAPRDRPERRIGGRSRTSVLLPDKCFYRLGRSAIGAVAMSR